MALDIEYDLGRWLYVPALFPWESFADAESWADTVSKEYGGTGRHAAPSDLVAWLRDYLLGAVRSNRDGTIRFAHLPNITAPNAIVDVYDLPHDLARPLSALTHENQGPAIRDAEVTAFPSDRLGDGVKAIRWVRLEDGSIMRATNWVWRTAGRDIVVIAASGDLPLSEALDPLIDEFARTISIAQ